MADVARLAGVSPMSVSNCFKRPEKVSDDTRAKILKAAAQLGYTPTLSPEISRPDEAGLSARSCRRFGIQVSRA